MNSNLRKSISAKTVLQRRNSYDLGRRSSVAENPSRNSGRLSNPKQRSSSEERKSGVNFGWHGSRRSSIFNEAKGQVKESRPLKDKGYQKRKVAEIVEFLRATECPHQIAESKLCQPTRKDFELVFQHIINLWDERYVVKKIEDEAPKILSDLGYPFIPAKSSFLHFSTTNFHTHLGILLFLMDIGRVGFDFDDTLFFQTGTEEQMVLLQFVTSCYFTKVTDDEIKGGMTQMVRQYRLNHDYDELKEKNAELLAILHEIQVELNNIHHLKIVSEQQQSNIKKYQDFFATIKDRRDKKKGVCEKLAEQLALKEQMLNELNELCIEKEKAYDAQGFDGKKQVSFYESQKKELMAKLKAKQEKRKEIQDKCWDMDMIQSEAIEKGASICEAFNELYPKMQQKAKSALEILKDTPDPQVRMLSGNLPVSFPDYHMRTNRLPHELPILSKLEEMKQKVEFTNACLKSIVTKQQEDLAAYEMEASRLSLGIKVAEAQKTKVERELLSKEKEFKKKWQEFEAAYEEGLKKIEKLQIEKMEYEEKIKKLDQELCAVQNIKNEKQKLLNDYLKSQKELFSLLSEEIKRRKAMVEESGESIHEALRKNMKK